MCKILRMHIDSAGMHHQFHRAHRLENLKIIGFHKFFPLGIVKVRVTGQSGRPIEYAEGSGFL